MFLLPFLSDDSYQCLASTNYLVVAEPRSLRAVRPPSMPLTPNKGAGKLGQSCVALRKRWGRRVVSVFCDGCYCLAHEVSLSLSPCRLQKALREVNKQVDAGSSDSSSGCQARLHLAASQLPVMDRALGEICRALLTSEDKACFAHLGGVASILKMLMLSLVDINAGQWTLSLK